MNVSWPTRRRVLWRWARRLAWAGLAASLLIALALAVAVFGWSFPTEALSPDAVASRRLADRHGRLLREALSDQEGRGQWVPLSEVSPWMPLAFMAIEDHRFKTHLGVDPVGIARAIRDNLAAGRVVAGGSTLTQQVVKHTVGSTRSLAGKIREAVLAMRLERAISKQAILEQYVNRVSFGHGAVGVEAAARLYLGKGAGALSLAEAALLAGVPRAPTLNNPITDPERARKRQRRVLDRMKALDLIDEATWQDALDEPLTIQGARRRLLAPHFTTWALSRLDKPGGVQTTLDLDIQAEVESAIEEILGTLEGRRVSQAAVLVLDNATAEVLAWVGSRDFFDPDAGQVDMVVGLRQPGSTLKPFVYGLALEAGVSPTTPIPDLPLFFPTPLGDYSPRNYDRRHHGWVRLREALANSYNVPAVWATWRVGVEAVLDRLRTLGFDSLSRPAEVYGLGLALGNGEVTLLELALAYRALAEGGLWRPLRWRTDEPMSPSRRVMPAPVAHLLIDILSDGVARVPAFGRHSALDTSFPSAVKTGTSTHFSDNWTVGFTTEVTVAVWVGNFDGQPMAQVSGVTGAAPLWHRVIRAVNESRPGRPFSRAGLTARAVCASADPQQPEGRCKAGTVTEWFLASALGGADMALAAPALPGLPRLSPDPEMGYQVTWPDEGDVFALDPDRPAHLTSLKLRARVPGADALVWEMDGQPLGQAVAPSITAEPGGDGGSLALATRWWHPTPGRHQVRVFPEGRPEAASRVVTFEVVGPAPD